MARQKYVEIPCNTGIAKGMRRGCDVFQNGRLPSRLCDRDEGMDLDVLPREEI